MNEIAFVGDVHGCLHELSELVEAARSETSSFVFLGDYVNRGPNSREVIDFLIRLQQTKGISTSFVMGNHDREFLAALTEDRFDSFLRMGGAATVRSYVGVPRADVLTQLKEGMPAAHLEFLSTLENRVVVAGVVATHERPAEGVAADTAGQFEIYGHSPQRGLEPRIERDRAFIDTGCGTLPGGRLTCLFWPSRNWIQSRPWKPIG